MSAMADNAAAMFTPPPSAPSLNSAPPTINLGGGLENGQGAKLIASVKNKVGGETRVSELPVVGGRLFIYEYVESMMENGIIRQTIRAASMIFDPTPATFDSADEAPDSPRRGRPPKKP